MRIAVIGRGRAGCSSVACALALILAQIRGSAKKPAPILCVASVPTSVAPAKHFGIPYRITRTLAGLQDVAAKALPSPGIVICDDATTFYHHALAAFKAQLSRTRKNLDFANGAHLGPDHWGTINREIDRALAAADLAGHDLIEVNREGPRLRHTPDGDAIEVPDALDLRGQAEAGRLADMWLRVTGGVESYTPVGRRMLVVVDDPAQIATGTPIALPELRSDADRVKLRKRLWEALGPSLKWSLPITDEVRTAFRSLEESADHWPQADADAERLEVLRFWKDIELLLMRKGVGGKTSHELQLRAELFHDAFGRGSSDREVFLALPLQQVQDGYLPFVAALDERLGASLEKKLEQSIAAVDSKRKKGRGE
jgi:hypothetical protein